jgi:hypothetical protein
MSNAKCRAGKAGRQQSTPVINNKLRIADEISDSDHKRFLWEDLRARHHTMRVH